MEYTRYTVAVGLLKNDRCYVSKRVNTMNFDGKWQFAGGKLEELEFPVDGAIREVYEETGLKINPDRLVYICPIFNDPTTAVCHTYIVNLTDAEFPQHTENKMSDWQLLEFDTVLTLNLMPGLKQVISKVCPDRMIKEFLLFQIFFLIQTLIRLDIDNCKVW
jgi:8-oxo-dGTP pyrophosphatase MutT (NUDIX family)